MNGAKVVQHSDIDVDDDDHSATGDGTKTHGGKTENNKCVAY